VFDERIFQLALAPAVADAVVLDLDDDGADFAMREVEHIFDDGYLRCLVLTVAFAFGSLC